MVHVEISEEKKDHFWQLLGFCGCYSDSLVDKFLEVLKALYWVTTHKGYCYYYDGQDVTELILHVLDRQKWTDHGTAVRGSFITEKGIEACKYLFEDGPAPALPEHG